MGPSQLTLDGREVEYAASIRTPRRWRIGPNQVAAFLALDLKGTLMSGALGSEIHRLRGVKCAAPHPPGSRAATCCKRASSVGYSTAASLRRRHLVERKENGWART